MKNITKIFLILAGLFGYKTLNAQHTSPAKSIHPYVVPALTGGKIDFSQFKGKKILVVNTASKCGFTPQYKDLEELSRAYASKLVVVGFPSNDFANQDPGSNEEIGAFCKKNYGVSFPMAAKVSVTGENKAPIYQFLTEKNKNGVKNIRILWNFEKILLDENGHILDNWSSRTSPMSPKILEYLK